MPSPHEPPVDATVNLSSARARPAKPPSATTMAEAPNPCSIRRREIPRLCIPSSSWVDGDGVSRRSSTMSRPGAGSPASVISSLSAAVDHARSKTILVSPARAQAEDGHNVTTRDLLVLLVVGVGLFSANMWGLSLISLDDATYARQGIEEGRSGQFFNPTWNGQPDFHKPPLQFWILARSFALFGENDFAARLPSAVMALGILAATYWIGVVTVGPPAAATG